MPPHRTPRTPRPATPRYPVPRRADRGEPGRVVLTAEELEDRFQPSATGFEPALLAPATAGTAALVRTGAIETFAAPVGAWEHGLRIASGNAFTTVANATLAVPPGALIADADAGGEVLSAALASGPSNGTLRLNPDGSFVYDPDPGFVGMDSFTYRAVDSAGAVSGAATVKIRVVEPNGIPAANADAYTAHGRVVWAGRRDGVLANDTGPDSDRLTAALVGRPANGSVHLTRSGRFLYVARPGFTGTDAFTYRATDKDGAVSPLATVTVTVGSAAGAAVEETYSVVQGQVLVSAGPARDDQAGQDDRAVPNSGGKGSKGDSRDNKDDKKDKKDKNEEEDEDRGFTAALINPAANGDVVLSADGSFTFTPRADYTGTDTFTYRISDGETETLITVRVTVLPAGRVSDSPATPDAGAGPTSNIGTGTGTDTDTDAGTTPATDAGTTPASDAGTSPSNTPAPGSARGPAPAARPGQLPALGPAGTGTPFATGAGPAPATADAGGPPGANGAGGVRSATGAPPAAVASTLIAFAALPDDGARADVLLPPDVKPPPDSGPPVATAKATPTAQPAAPPAQPAVFAPAPPPAIPREIAPLASLMMPDSIAIADAVGGALDRVARELGADSDERAATDAAVATGVVATAGYVLLNTRAVYWFVSALLARPAVWRRFDPIDVIYAWEREQDLGKRPESPAPGDGESLQSMVG